MLVKLHFTILEDIFILYNFKFCSDLYGDFVAPQLQTDLYVQSWLNGRGKLPSICTRRKYVVSFFNLCFVILCHSSLLQEFVNYSESTMLKASNST